ncbi:hypothetical protein J437_LFUL016128 [Ladona fulva]|uniref:RNA-directed DNA polymerase n=1 Tax=Ladona fulva TaxID=123851 RepID=A0A8K0KLH8_LADFU|nr:hypothetical protein J437_LFUL016128 [Ladona fulva]
MPKISFLGHQSDENGLRPDATKVMGIHNFPISSSVRHLREFLRLESYYRRFVKGFAAISKPLHAFLKKDRNWEWWSEEDRYFRYLKGKLLAAPALWHFQDELPCVIHTDASYDGLGALLVQRRDEQEHVVAYKSFGATFLGALAARRGSGQSPSR